MNLSTLIRFVYVDNNETYFMDIISKTFVSQYEILNDIWKIFNANELKENISNFCKCVNSCRDLENGFANAYECGSNDIYSVIDMIFLLKPFTLSFTGDSCCDIFQTVVIDLNDCCIFTTNTSKMIKINNKNSLEMVPFIRHEIEKDNYIANIIDFTINNMCDEIIMTLGPKTEIMFELAKYSDDLHNAKVSMIYKYKKKVILNWLEKRKYVLEKIISDVSERNFDMQCVDATMYELKQINDMILNTH